MGMRRTILKFGATTVWSGNGDTATNMTTVNPAPLFTADQEFPLPGIIGWASQEALDMPWNISSLSGTNPSVQFFIDVADGSGNWYQIYASPVITAAGSGFASIGAARQTPVDIGLQGRVRWVIGGTSNPSATGALTLIGT